MLPASILTDAISNGFAVFERMRRVPPAGRPVTFEAVCARPSHPGGIVRNATRGRLILSVPLRFGPGPHGRTTRAQSTGIEHSILAAACLSRKSATFRSKNHDSPVPKKTDGPCPSWKCASVRRLSWIS